MKQYYDDILSEKLDDLLVRHNLEPERAIRFSDGTSRGMGMIIGVKESPRIKFEIYPNETEEPHFKVTYKNCTCRFKISDCSPMKAEAKNGVPTPIKKVMKEIQFVWKSEKKYIVQKWNDLRPTNQHHGHQYIR